MLKVYHWDSVKALSDYTNGEVMVVCEEDNLLLAVDLVMQIYLGQHYKMALKEELMNTVPTMYDLPWAHFVYGCS